MGQFSVENPDLPGSVLSGTQQGAGLQRPSCAWPRHAPGQYGARFEEGDHVAPAIADRRAPGLSKLDECQTDPVHAPDGELVRRDVEQQCHDSGRQQAIIVGIRGVVHLIDIEIHKGDASRCRMFQALDPLKLRQGLAAISGARPRVAASISRGFKSARRYAER